jgi:hypothetical protein
MWAQFLLITVGATLVIGEGAEAEISLRIDPSVRSSGMGGASNAVFWGSDPNDWANPALLGYQQGARYSWSETQFVPSLASDVWFRTSRVVVGVGGIGVAVPGNLKSWGSARLEYGQGSSDPFEEIHAWGVGASLSQLVETSSLLAGVEPPAFTRVFDVAGGVNGKHIEVAFDPAAAGETNTTDIGFLVRVTPINQLESRSIESQSLPLRVDAAYGWSILNNDDDALVSFLGQPSPISRVTRNGVSARFAMGLPGSLQESLGGFLVRSLSPLISLGIAADWEHVQQGDSDAGGYDVERLGGEITVANVLALRLGHITDKAGDIRGGTDGWGLGLQIGDFASVRFDEATIPQARSSGLPDVKRAGYTVLVDPIKLFQ